VKSIHEIRSKRGAEDAEDLKLLKRVAVKDKVAFENLYLRFYPQLSRYLSRLVRRPEMVEEVVNDTLFVVWEKADQFQGRSKVLTWVIGIAYLKGIKALDKLRRIPDQHADELDDNIEETNDLISKLGLEEWLTSGLDLISADQRSVVELTYFFGYSYQEIAETMGCPVNTVKTRMFHARRRLANLLPQLQEQGKDSRAILDSESGSLKEQPSNHVKINSDSTRGIQ
jgi:RNA polymerase sigma factor (sigma-70 family)